jgi:hypothetical protein
MFVRKDIKCILEGNEKMDKGNTCSVLLAYDTVSDWLVATDVK